MDKVSIITPTYNSEKFIAETIVSIQNQTYNNWELLITDDCSTDNTKKIIFEFQEKDIRIKFFELKKNSGAGIARNYSIKKSTGRYIAFCDSDDKWKENKLEVQINFMKKNNLPLTYSSYDVIDQHNNFKKTIICPEKITYKKMLRNNYVGCLTAIYDSRILDKKYMSSIRRRQDWALWLNILKIIKTTEGIKDSLAIYRDRSNSISSNKIKMLTYNWRIYYDILGYNLIKSSFLIINFMLFYVIKKIK